MKTVFSLVVVTALFLALTFKASADPSAHPGYLRALSDLRMVRYLVQRDHPDPARRDLFCKNEIDLAIKEIKQAAIDDGKNLDDHPMVDPTWDWAGRLHHASELLDKAHQDIAKNEDNVYAQGLQARALHHIDKAHLMVIDMIRDM